ncbi:hypothetical protein KFK09_020215 [Dendrobium nobile]|uniref:Uncharacterized protein n=1 Tax=Dendrobium nobile TaxID=94219 RepID=A0A8T3AUC0_DENNO|nr:hypothetical protein KFK09_020215 [Dendrobium nobile]
MTLRSLSFLPGNFATAWCLRTQRWDTLMKSAEITKAVKAMKAAAIGHRSMQEEEDRWMMKIRKKSK